MKALGTIVMLTGAALSLIPAGAPAGEAPQGCSPAASRIAFIRELPAGNEVYTVRPDGTRIRRLTNNETDEWGPSWSPDGRRLAFSSHRDGDSEIYVVNRSGKVLEKVTNNAWSDELPDWSPDGRRMVFSSTKDDPHDSDFDLFIRGHKGTIRKLVGGSNTEGNAAWSPRGGRIAFDRNDRIYTIRVDGTHLKALTPKGTIASNPAWSPDGRFITFQNDFVDTTWMDIYRVDANGANMTALLETELNEQSPSLSPSGTRLAHTHDYQLSIAPADGSEESDHLFEEDNAEYGVDWGNPISCS